MMSPLVSKRSNALTGEIAVPGDKSVSHRALMLGALAVGETRIDGLLEGADVLATAAAMRALGAEIERREDGTWRVFGRGVGGLAEPEAVLDMGNSGTGARLLMGLLAGHPFATTLSGDASLSKRPMGRVMTPLRDMGADFVARDGDRLPLTVVGANPPLPIVYRLPVASAQVKSAVLLAGLNAPGRTTVIEPQPTRDHTERMLRYLGTDIETADEQDGRHITLTGQPELVGRDISVPGDISSAAFPLVAALLTPGSDVVLEGVGTNPLRTGLIDTLLEMGAVIDRRDERDAGEPLCDLAVGFSPLRGTDVPASRAPSMIDEYPILAVAAACAEGTTRLQGLAELRVKESDRLAAIAKGLSAAGVEVEETEESLTIHGAGRPPRGGADIAVELDHRIAMAFLVLGGVTEEPVAIDDGDAIDTSFPGFAELMNGLGGHIEAA